MEAAVILGLFIWLVERFGLDIEIDTHSLDEYDR